MNDSVANDKRKALGNFRGEHIFFFSKKSSRSLSLIKSLRLLLDLQDIAEKMELNLGNKSTDHFNLFIGALFGLAVAESDKLSEMSKTVKCF